ncbi:MAG TPA: hypothetical protein VFG15_30175 [Amycolatopsis sp.]|nr:hypothetical protein [Amycolatopsis sp.]
MRFNHVKRIADYLDERDRRAASGGDLHSETIHSFGLYNGAAQLIASDLRALLTAHTALERLTGSVPTDDRCQLTCGRRPAFIASRIGRESVDIAACGNHLAAAYRAAVGTDGAYAGLVVVTAVDGRGR